MRTIKFRAWNIVSKQWINISSLQYTGDGIGAVWELKEGENEMYGIHQVILSQFTGLLDKNGQEIYEGDICRDRSQVWIIKFGNVEIEDNDMYGSNNVVGFYKQRADGEIRHMDFINETVVIGNIYVLN